MMKFKIPLLAFLLLAFASAHAQGNFGLRSFVGVTNILTDATNAEFEPKLGYGFSAFGAFSGKRFGGRWELGYENGGGTEKTSKLTLHLHYLTSSFSFVAKKLPLDGQVLLGAYFGLLTNPIIEKEGSTSGPGPVGRGYYVELKKYDFGVQTGYEYTFFKQKNINISADVRCKYGLTNNSVYDSSFRRNFTVNAGVNIFL